MTMAFHSYFPVMDYIPLQTQLDVLILIGPSSHKCISFTACRAFSCSKSAKHDSTHHVYFYFNMLSISKLLSHLFIKYSTKFKLFV